MDLLSFQILYRNGIWTDEIESMIHNIQQIFRFDNRVYVKVDSSLAELSMRLGIPLPDWVKGVAMNNVIYLLNPIAWKQDGNDTLASIFIHEYVHTAVFGTFKTECPLWLNEGLALYFSGQYKTMRLERFINAGTDCLMESYEEYALRTLELIRKYGDRDTVEEARKCNNFLENKMFQSV